MTVSPAERDKGGADVRVVDRENPAAGHGTLGGKAALAVAAIGVAFSLFQIWTAAYSPISSSSRKPTWMERRARLEIGL